MNQSMTLVAPSENRGLSRQMRISDFSMGLHPMIDFSDGHIQGIILIAA